jgi:hypothetical protein
MPAWSAAPRVSARLLPKFLLVSALGVTLAHCGGGSTEPTGEAGRGGGPGGADHEGGDAPALGGGSKATPSGGSPANRGEGGSSAGARNEAGGGTPEGGSSGNQGGHPPLDVGGNASGGDEFGAAGQGGVTDESGGAPGAGHGGEAGAASPPAECDAGERKCEGGVITCEAGKWSEATPCVAQTCVDGYCQGECAPGDTTCVGNAPATCDATGHWSASASCPVDRTCLDGACGGECGPGEQVCRWTTLPGGDFWMRASCEADGQLHASFCPQGEGQCIQGHSSPRTAMCSCGWLYEGFRIDDGSFLNSCDLQYSAQVDNGYFRLFSVASYPTPIWEVGQASGGPGSVLVMQGDGNLVLYAPGCTGPNGSCWSSGTSGHPGADFVVQEDGNLVIYGPDCPPPYGACWSRYGG